MSTAWVSAISKITSESHPLTWILEGGWHPDNQATISTVFTSDLSRFRSFVRPLNRPTEAFFGDVVRIAVRGKKVLPHRCFSVVLPPCQAPASYVVVSKTFWRVLVYSLSTSATCSSVKLFQCSAKYNFVLLPSLTCLLLYPPAMFRKLFVTISSPWLLHPNWWQGSPCHTREVACA